MLLTLDLGNTSLFIGVCDDGKVIDTYRTSTNIHKSSDEYVIIFKDLLGDYINKIDGVICSSVVPCLNYTIREAIKRLFKIDALFVGPGLKTGLPIRIDTPNELGSDLVCDCVGALNKYGNSTIVVDLGTATKILVIDKNGAFVGGTISSGLKISIEALAGKTQNLTETSLEMPKNIIGKNTRDCINSGTVIGTKLMIEAICKQMEEEIGYPLKRVVTGGYANVINNFNDFIYDFNLIHHGLYVIYLKNQGGKEHE